MPGRTKLLIAVVAGAAAALAWQLFVPPIAGIADHLAIRDELHQALAALSPERCAAVLLVLAITLGVSAGMLRAIRPQRVEGRG